MPMVLLARDLEPTVFAIVISIPAKILGKRLISMMGSAIDLPSLEATLNLFETLSGDGSVEIDLLLFQAFSCLLNCEFWMWRWTFSGPSRDRKKKRLLIISSISSISSTSDFDAPPRASGP